MCRPRWSRSQKAAALPAGKAGETKEGEMALIDQVAIVTGAGGSGCGRAIAYRLARESALVEIADIHEAGIRASSLSSRKWALRCFSSGPWHWTYFRERSRCCCRWGTYGMRNRLRTTQPLSAEG
jgi:hypothetical protein